MSATPSTESKPFRENDCPYCGGDVFRDYDELTKPAQHSHRAITCSEYTCEDCEWAYQKYEKGCVRATAQVDGYTTDLGFRERIPNGYVLLVRPVDGGGRTRYEIEGRVEMDADVTPEYEEMMDAGDLEAYLGEFDALGQSIPRISFN